LQYWLKKWLFALSLSIGLLIPFSIWATKTIWWSIYQQPWDLPMGVYGMLTILIFVLLLIALVSIIIQSVPRRARGKIIHYALILLTLAFSVACWWIISIITNPYFT